MGLSESRSQVAALRAPGAWQTQIGLSISDWCLTCSHVRPRGSQALQQAVRQQLAAFDSTRNPETKGSFLSG